MKIIGLTGGIACGKSTVSSILKQLDARILDADAMAHELMQPKQPLWNLYVSHWGERILKPGGTLDRRAIGAIVFSDPAERQWLDSAAHPILLAEAQRRLDRFKKQHTEVAVLDVPLLFESGWDRLCGEIWVASVSEDVQLQRLMARNDWSEDEARARIAAQMPLAEKCARADVVLDNSGTLDDLRTQVVQAYRNLKQAESLECKARQSCKPPSLRGDGPRERRGE
ncbi:MAG: dephospho-CoA kinase [Selenomonadaceae bacterium]|nr:dephospho-CoA kinase [Selenomonadaceae bacterium]